MPQDTAVQQSGRTGRDSSSVGISSDSESVGRTPFEGSNDPFTGLPKTTLHIRYLRYDS